MAVLTVDSLEYDLLHDAVLAVEDVPGFTCEIGVRSGGGSQIIMAASPDDRVHIGIDPWGQLPYYYADNEVSGLSPFDAKLRERCYSELYVWAAFEKRYLLLLTLEDSEFFARFADGVVDVIELDDVAAPSAVADANARPGHIVNSIV